MGSFSQTKTEQRSSQDILLGRAGVRLNKKLTL